MIRAESMRIAALDSSTHDLYLTRHGVDPIRYLSMLAAFDDLRAGRVDAVFYDLSSIKGVAERTGGHLAVSPTETRERYGIAVGKGRRELKAALDAVIAERTGK